MIIKRVSAREEILGIKKLQTENLKTRLDLDEIEKEGFVTAEYTIEFLELMHGIEPSIIAKEDDNVVGYALVATRSIIGQHTLLDDLFHQIDKHSFNNVKLKDTDYVVVGQLCVGKSHRGQGLVQKMHAFYKDELSGKYAYCLTDVDEKNPRSVKAHLKSGFTILDTLTYDGSKWYIVIWDWNNNEITLTH